ncbi:MAG TPA: LuxR C-terminal-related transcriptional regulator [Jiangellaceae bacterium]|nr:LuxR C-terminal-related transcriptional regulator [Jiangellaceae bacterium]
MKCMLPIHFGAEIRDRFNNLSEVQQKQIIEEFLAIAEAPGVFGANQPRPAAATTVPVEGGRTLMVDGPSIEPGLNREDDPIYGREDDYLVLTGVLLAGTDGYVSVFADEGPPMAVILRGPNGAHRPGRTSDVSGPGQEHRIVPALGPERQEAPAAAASGLIVPLTARELEVLGLIAMGKSNRNIADELVVTLETVKKHASHIYAKLGAANRTEAVRNAQNLGLLSTSVATLGPSGCPLRGCPFVEQTAISFKEDGHEVHAADPLRR